ncbi:hypothetical protein ACO0SA_003665 [Hanseniaspora valbyensis]
MSSNNKFKKHIQLPKTLLNELGDSSDHQDDQHYKVNSFGKTNNKKRKFQGKNMTRKERRKQERQDKKRKINPNNKNNNNTQQQNRTVNNKNLSKENKKIDSEDVDAKEELNIPTDDSLDSDDFDEFDENDLTPEEWKELRALEGHKESGSSSSSSSESESESSESDSETDTKNIKPKKLLLKPTLKQKLAKKVISRNSKKHVSFNKKIMEKLIPARPNYGELPASSEDDENEYYEEDYDIDDEDEDDDESEEGDDNSYLDQLALSNSDDDDDEDNSEEEEEVEEEKEMTVEETMAALKAAKEKKQQKQSESSEEDDFDEDDLEGDYSEEEEEEKEMTVEETMAALKAAKEKKQQKQVESSEDDYSEEEEEDEKEMTVEETMAALKAAKEAKNKNKETAKTSKLSKITKKDDAEEDFVPYEDPESDEDERNIKYYAKKLNMGKKTKKLRALDEYDAIGGLLEGLDFFDNYGENLGEYGDLAINDNANDISSSESDSDSSDESDSEDEEGDDDEEVYDEFDENDLTPEEWAQLRELEDSEMDYSDQSDEEEEEKLKKKKKKSSKKKENLYGLDTQLDDEDQLAIASLENDMSNVDPQLTKDVKTLFNKLSESNINNIISSLLELFDSKPRQACINAIIDRIIIDCNIKEKLLDQFLMNYIGCVYAIWRFKGIDFGALFIQKLVEKIIETLESEEDTSSYDDDENNSSKKGANLMTLLSFAFNFGVITNKLIYNLLDLLADVSNEFSVELILKCVSISGVLLRGENPKDLNMIINKLLSNLEDKKKDNQEEEDDDDDEDDSRLQFLVDTLRDLKLNKINKNLITKTNHSQMKKSISKSLKIDSKTLGSNSSQSIQVSLDDILNIDTKGKWWLIGGSYRENMINNNNQNEDENNEDLFDNDIEFSDIELQDDFIDELPDYNKLAIQNKMSSSLSKAIFVGITSSQDPLDCIMRLDKLNIKKKIIKNF